MVFVVNPSSGAGAAGRNWRRAEALLRERVGPFAVWPTTRAGEAADLARRALEAGAEVVVAVGGDGTIGEVVSGFFDGDRAVRPRAALAVLPAGTGGDLRKTFGWSNAPAEAAERIRARRVRRVDVGRIAYVGLDGRAAERHFLNVASFGVSGRVDQAVDGAPKLLGGRAGFALGSLRALLGWKDVRCRVRFDGGPWETIEVTCVAAANGRLFGGGMLVAPEAVPDDGLFDVTIWSGYGLADFVLRAKRLYDGSHVRMEGTRTLRARRIEAEAEGGATCLLDVDGEAPGRLPATIELLPGALPLLV